MKYRPEIDGLRAVAVIPVILFHAGFGSFSGGFVGVDVFFVISGYLITTLIWKDLEAGKFSNREFYERRARRILPALFFVVLCTLPPIWLVAYPSQFESYIKSLGAVCLFASNIYFWKESDDYFDLASEEKPLLHTWSLAVEEQYYILFPIALMLVWKLGRKRTAFLVGATTVLSFVLCEVGLEYFTVANFYILPTRAWEILAGSLCAFWLLQRDQRGNNALAWMGLALITASVFLIDGETPFPSRYTLAPVVGASLIVLFARPGTHVAALLSWKPMVGIGLVSYSLYLWHQPLFAIVRIIRIEPPGPLMMLGLSVLSGLLAYVSWAYVEAPFRVRGQRSVLPTQASVFAASGSALLITGVFAGALTLWPQLRVGTVAVVNPTLIDPRAEMDASWGPWESEQMRSFTGSQERRVLVIGDSHSNDVFNALHFHESAWDSEIRRSFLKLSCAKRAAKKGTDPTQCIQEQPLYQEATHVLIAIRWAAKSDWAWLPPLIEELRSQGRQVAIVGNTPEYEPVAPLLIRALDRDDNLTKSAADELFYEKRREEVPAVNEQLRRVADASETPFLSRAQVACTPAEATCEALTPTQAAVYSDYGHLTLAGAAYLGERMVEQSWLDPLLGE